LREPRFVVYTRADCSLCDAFIAELAEQLGPSRLSYEVRDVDADPASHRRFGLKIPVLTFDGSLVCHGRYDARAVARLLGR
jgi:hypothetical protein